MPLSATQQAFLDNYIRKHPIKGKGKKERAKGFAIVRTQAMALLAQLPQKSERYANVKAAIDAADALADAGKFNAAADAMRAAMPATQAAVDTFDPTRTLTDTGQEIGWLRDTMLEGVRLLPDLVSFMAAVAGLKAGCRVAPGDVPVPGPDLAAHERAMKQLIQAKRTHLQACETALSKAQTATSAIDNSTDAAAVRVSAIKATVADVAKACSTKPQRDLLKRVLTQLQTDIEANATLAPLKNGQNLRTADELKGTCPTEITALQTEVAQLKGMILQWEAALLAQRTQGQQGRDAPDVRNRGADLPDAIRQQLADQAAELSTGPASQKGASTKPRRTDGVPTFDTAGFFAAGGLPAYVAPAQGAAPDPQRAAGAKNAAKAQLRTYLNANATRPDTEAMFDLSLRGAKELGLQYARAQGWDPRKLNPDQKAIAQAIGEGMFEAVRETTADKLVTSGPSPVLEMGGKRYGNPQFLAQGALGSVSRYKCETDDSYVVVKSAIGMTDDARAAMVREIQTHRYLMQGDDQARGRDHIVGLDSAVTDEQGNLHMVMEVVEGGDLNANRFGLMVAAAADALPEQARVVLQQAAIKQAIEGMIYLRDQNVVHFDVKGANMLVTADGKVKIADFGSAGVGTDASGARPHDPYEHAGTRGFDGGGPRAGQAVDERFDTYSLGRLINLMQGNVSAAGWTTDDDAPLSGAVKRLTEAMSHRDPNQRPTLEAVLESSYLKNLEAYDPEVVEELSAASVAYAKALGKEMPALRQRVPPDYLEDARGRSRLDSVDKVSFGDLSAECARRLEVARKEIAKLTRERDGAPTEDKKFDLVERIRVQEAEIRRAQEVIAMFGQSDAAQVLAARIKELSDRLVRGSADALNDPGDQEALVRALASEDDPAGFMTTVSLPASMATLKQLGIDAQGLRELAAGYQLALADDAKARGAQVRALEDRVSRFIDALPDSLGALRELLENGLLSIVKAVRTRAERPGEAAADREYNRVWRDLRAAANDPKQFHAALASPANIAVLNDAGLDKAVVTSAVKAAHAMARMAVPAQDAQYMILSKGVERVLAQLPVDGPAAELAAEVARGLTGGLAALRASA